MRKTIILLIVLGALATGCGSSPNPTTSSAASSTVSAVVQPRVQATTTTESPSATTTTVAEDHQAMSTVERLQASLNAWADRPDIPGVIASIDVAGTGFHWAGAAGATTIEDGEPLSAEHPFRIASVTKTITAATVLNLADNGAVELDATIDAYLPDTIVDKVHIFGGWSRGTEITIRQLLAHTSGIHDYVTDPAFVPDVLAAPERVWTPEALIDYATTHGEPHFSPGEGFHYSDTGYVLLGLIIEHVIGEPLHQAYRTLIFDPLGMNDTYLEGLEPSRGLPLSSPYIGEIDGSTIHPSVDWAGGGLVSTAADLSLFIRALGEGRLLEPASFSDMSTQTVTETGPGYELLYGLGYLGFRSGSFHMVGHDGFWGSFMYSVPDLGVTITGTINQADVSQLDMIFDLLEALTT